MSLGTLYGTTEIRALPARAIIKHYGLDIENVSKTDSRFAENFPLGLRPGFIGPDGVKLTQSIAITLHVLSLSKEGKQELLGDSEVQYAQILEWMSFVNCEILPTAIRVFGPKVKGLPYIAEVVESLDSELHRYMSVLEGYLKDKEYLVGNKYTLADLYVLALLIRPFQYLFDKEWRETHPFVIKWFETVVKEPILMDVFGPFTFIDKRIVYNA